MRSGSIQHTMEQKSEIQRHIQMLYPEKQGLGSHLSKRPCNFYRKQTGSVGVTSKCDRIQGKRPLVFWRENFLAGGGTSR